MTSSAPRLSISLMRRLDVSDALVGDVVEEYRRGRSRGWYWRQVIVAILVSARQDVRRRKLHAAGSVITGWTILLVLFLLGDRVADGMAYRFWGWTRPLGYGLGVWWPLQVSAVVVSYSGFALAGWAVVRLARGHAAGAMLAYVTSILAVLLGGALIAAIVGPIAVWHPFFYVISVTLPYQGRSGLVLAPLITILSGLAGTRHPQGISDGAGPLDRSGQFK